MVRPGLPMWPAYDGAVGYQVMHLAPVAAAAPDSRPRPLRVPGQPVAALASIHR